MLVSCVDDRWSKQVRSTADRPHHDEACDSNRFSAQLSVAASVERHALMHVPEGFRSLDFLDGTSHIVPENTCRGCLMNEMEGQLPDLLDPIYDDGYITVRQDAEWAVPGFMIVASRAHVGALDEMSLLTAMRLTSVTRAVRRSMRQALGVKAVQMYQEDKLDRPHFHIWLLPLWPRVMAEQCINPRIYESNVISYLKLFDVARYEAEIRSCVHRLRGHLKHHPPESLTGMKDSGCT